ncbi:hypothetical protein QVD17_11084 [Tagetes erecta]|uniref:Uncharacterized protein n=1 Tax=Tagetes erecta TaxID=13708 RepID=A0AAD8L7T4_TARER|nr:hypothetical protein QVD17_11084 [Tagetes erecta]
MDMDIDKKKKKKKRPSDTMASSPTSKRINKSDQQDIEELIKGSSDEAFHLSWETVNEILQVICSQKTPNDKWDVYAKSFYHKTYKLYTSFPKEQEEEEDEDEEEEEEEVEDVDLDSVLSSSEDISSEEDDEDMNIVNDDSSSEEDVPVEEDGDYRKVFRRPQITGPYDFGSYAPGEQPKCMPHHLYPLVKEAADILNPSKWPSSNPDWKKLNFVEKKISFFYTYFHSHLPTGWTYSWDTVFSLVEDYNPPMPQPRYNTKHYTPISTLDRFSAQEYDAVTRITRKDMIRIMSIVHSRTTPAYWKWSAQEVLFYCKLCSCFGIDYCQLETASDDDVSLMYVPDHNMHLNKIA